MLQHSNRHNLTIGNWINRQKILGVAPECTQDNLPRQESNIGQISLKNFALKTHLEDFFAENINLRSMKFLKVRIVVKQRKSKSLQSKRSKLYSETIKNKYENHNAMIIDVNVKKSTSYLA